MTATAPEAAPPTPPAPRRRVRARYVVAAVVCAAAVGWVLWQGLLGSVFDIETVSEAVAARADQGDRRLQVAGEVVPGTIEEHDEADGERSVSFDVTDGDATIAVLHTGERPQLFEDGAPVVVEGAWHGEVFASDKILIRHGSDYTPPDVDSDHAPEVGDPR